MICAKVRLHPVGIAAEVAGPETNAVLGLRRNSGAGGDCEQSGREVDPRVDGKRERSPKTRVDLNEVRRSIRRHFELDHGDTMPPERTHQLGREPDEPRIRSNRPTVRTAPASQW